MLALLLMGVAAVACARVIGIEDATCDPTVAGCPAAIGAKLTSPLCQDYCDTIMGACTGTNEQYVSMDACLSVCSFLPVGQAGVVGNSLHCRLEVVEIAATSPEKDSYCPAAGPTGDGPGDESDCTGEAGDTNDPCESLCLVLMPACKRFPQYGSNDECASACRAEVATASNDEHYTSSTAVDPLPDRGNNVSCRVWHASVAATGPDDSRVAGLHCLHAAGGEPCVDEQP
jgi:hypothetical protein